MKNIIKPLLFMLGMPGAASYGMQQNVDVDHKECYSIIVPGQNGIGGYSFRINNIINTEKKKIAVLEKIGK